LDVDIITSSPPPKASEFMKRMENLPLFPFSESGYPAWAAADKEEIRDALKGKISMHHEHDIVRRRKGRKQEREHPAGEV
jgi:putative membrane protein